MLVRREKQHTITKYDAKKRTYSVTFEKVAPMTIQDCCRLSDIVDEEMLGSCFEILEAMPLARTGIEDVNSIDFMYITFLT